MPSFDDFDLPFPLFKADLKDAANVAGHGRCSICGRNSEIRIILGIGCALMVNCPGCGEENGLDAHDRMRSNCKKCLTPIPFPTRDSDIATCFKCLREGKSAITKDTELGMISWEQATEGLTHGSPGLRHPDFDMVATDSDWIRAKLPREDMYELLRTPTYLTIQGDHWLFCCKRPMIFMGQWSREEFSKQAHDGDGKELLNKIVDDVIPGLWEDTLHDETGIYIFKCQSCARLRGHWDLA